MLRLRPHGFGLIGGKFSKLDHLVNDRIRCDFSLLVIHGGEAFAVPDDLANRTQPAERARSAVFVRRVLHARPGLRRIGSPAVEFAQDELLLIRLKPEKFRVFLKHSTGGLKLSESFFLERRLREDLGEFIHNEPYFGR